MPARASRRAELQAAGWDCAADLREARELGARAAVIATNTGRHEADALEALSLGLDVLVEKPLAVDSAASRRIASAAAASGRKAFVGCVLRFSPSLLEFRGRLPAFGPVTSVDIVCRSYLPDWRPGRDYRESYSARADEGGVLRDLIHEIDYAGWLFGWPRSVLGLVERTGSLGIESDDRASLEWTAPGGARVKIALDYLTRSPSRRISAVGPAGELVWDKIAGAVETRRSGAAVERAVFDEDAAGRFTAQAAAFLSAVSGGGAGVLATLEDGVRALTICDAARRATATRREESLS